MTHNMDHYSTLFGHWITIFQPLMLMISGNYHPWYLSLARKIHSGSCFFYVSLASKETSASYIWQLHRTLPMVHSKWGPDIAEWIQDIFKFLPFQMGDRLGFFKMENSWNINMIGILIKNFKNHICLSSLRKIQPLSNILVPLLQIIMSWWAFVLVQFSRPQF